MPDPFDYQDAVFKHDAIEPPRKNHIGEMVFAASWKKHLELPMAYGDGHPNEGFVSIFAHVFTFKLDDRVSSVAASFITWLGTNCDGLKDASREAR